MGAVVTQQKGKITVGHTVGPEQSGVSERRHTNTNLQRERGGFLSYLDLFVWRGGGQNSRPHFLLPHQTVGATYRAEGFQGCMKINSICYLLLPVSRAWLSVALAIGRAVTGIWVSRSWWRGDSAAWRGGECRAGLVP